MVVFERHLSWFSVKCYRRKGKNAPSNPYPCNPARPLQESPGPSGPGIPKESQKSLPGPGSKKCPKQSRNSLRSLEIDCFETPETVSRLFRTLFGPRGLPAPGDSFETLSGFWARSGVATLSSLFSAFSSLKVETGSSEEAGESTLSLILQKIRSRPGKPNQRKGQNEKFMNFAHFCEFWCFSLGKQARFTLNFCSGTPLRKVHEPTFFGLVCRGHSWPILVSFFCGFPCFFSLCVFPCFSEHFLRVLNPPPSSDLKIPPFS